MFTKGIKYFRANIGFVVLVVLAVGLGVPIVYWAIFEILGLSDIRRYLNSTSGGPLIVGGFCGIISSFIVVSDMNKKIGSNS